MTGAQEQQFKYLHRKAGLSKHYASDLDLVLVDKHPKRISGFIDFKYKDEPIKFTQSIIFPKLIDIAPVFIIRAETDIDGEDRVNHRFTVSEFVETVDSKQHPPDVKTEVIEQHLSWGGLISYANESHFLDEGGNGLIGWEHKIRYPHKSELNTMPSEHSPASNNRTDYQNTAKKMLETKNDKTINSLIKGMDDVERVDHWIRTEAQGECRQEIIGALNRKKMELED
jgi:hypothetical protein